MVSLSIPHSNDHASALSGDSDSTQIEKPARFTGTEGSRSQTFQKSNGSSEGKAYERLNRFHQRAFLAGGAGAGSDGGENSSGLASSGNLASGLALGS